MDANSLVVGIELVAGIIAALTVIFGALGWFIDMRNKNSLNDTMSPLTETLQKIDTNLSTQETTMIGLRDTVKQGHANLENKIEDHQKFTAVQFEDVKHQQGRQLEYIKQVDEEHQETAKEVSNLKVEVAEVKGEVRRRE